MRGRDRQPSSMFSYISAARRAPKDHPLRPIRAMADAALERLGPCFDAICASSGRPSIAPEKLLRARLPQVLYTVRGKRMLMEQLDYNCFFRWFVGLNLDDPAWAVVDQARAQGLFSDERFTVDGTLIEAWASHQSFQRKDAERKTPPDDPGNPSVDFHGERRRNDTHQSTTDPAARLARKGDDRQEFIEELRDRQATPHPACKPTTIIDERTTRHPGYPISQRKRKRIEEILAWLKTIAGLRKTRHRGVPRVGWMFSFALAAYNLVRMRNLACAAP